MLKDVIVIYTLELCSFWKNRCIKSSAGDIFYISHYYHSITPLTRDDSKSCERTQTFLSHAKTTEEMKAKCLFQNRSSKALAERQFCHTFLTVTKRSAIVAEEPAFIPLSHRQMDTLLTQQTCCSIDPYTHTHTNLCYCQQQGAAKVYSGASGSY